MIICVIVTEVYAFASEGAKEEMGNIYYIDATSGRDSNDGLSPLDMDYNCWYQSQGKMIKWLSDEYTMAQFSRYQAEKGQDGHSIAADPAFTDIGNLDFRPASGSPVLTPPGIGTVSPKDTGHKPE